MAGAAQGASTNVTTDFFGAIGAALDAVLTVLDSIPNSMRAAREIETLLSLSDDDLALRGLKREDVARTVLKRNFGF